MDLGAMGVNSLFLLKLQDNASKAFIQLRSNAGRPPIVNGTVSGIRAKRNETKSNEVHWTVHNVASYNHTRSFATRFRRESDATTFLTLFNSFSTTAEVDAFLGVEAEKITQDDVQMEIEDQEANIDLNPDDDFNQFTQTWPEWHEMITPFD
jgi:hypothetical protein